MPRYVATLNHAALSFIPIFVRQVAQRGGTSPESLNPWLTKWIKRSVKYCQTYEGARRLDDWWVGCLIHSDGLMRRG